MPVKELFEVLMFDYFIFIDPFILFVYHFHAIITFTIIFLEFVQEFFNFIY